MDYAEFKAELIERVKDKLGKDNVQLQEVIKQGDVLHEALVIGNDGEEIHPTIYIDKLYDSYKRGESFDSLIDYIISTSSNKFKFYHGKVIMEKFQEYETIKNLITFKVLNFKRNMRYLQDAVFVKRLDLALVFQIEFYLEKGESCSITIRKKHLLVWNITEEEIYQQAMKNVTKKGYILKTLHSVLSELINIKELRIQEECLHVPEMYILTNKSHVNGAGVIFYPGVLKHCSQEIAKGSDLIILPSSIHEVMLLKIEGIETELLRDMVQSVNRTEVANDEILSNNVYSYESETDRILIL